MRADGDVVVLVSDSEAPCGVEAFARGLSKALGARAATRVLGAEAGARAPGAAVVLNLPVVAWKRALAAPVREAAAARLSGQRVVVVLHEWADLDWRRRASYLPLLAMADAVLFSCPVVRRGFEAGRASALAGPAGGLLPIPPNVSPPPALREGPHGARVRRARDQGRTVLGHFGSIYPRKRSAFVLEVAAEMKRRGEAPFVVFAGSFVRGRDDVERDFFDRVGRLGLADDVLVTGYIGGENELFGLLGLVDVFAYSFAEGLSTRRASVLTCLMAGKPVVANAPPDTSDFDHHPVYRSQLTGGLLRLVPTAADAAAFADAVLAGRGASRPAPAILAEAAWSDVAEAFAAALGRLPAARMRDRRAGCAEAPTAGAARP